MEATLKSPSKAPKKAVPVPAPVPDWKQWKQYWLDGGQKLERWGGMYTTPSLRVDLKMPASSIICGCCGAAWILPGGKVVSPYQQSTERRADAVLFSDAENFYTTYWADRQGIYFGEFQDAATLRKDMGMEDGVVWKSFEIHDGKDLHSLVWKEVV